MSNEVDVVDEDEEERTTRGRTRSKAYGDREPQSVDEMRATQDEFYAPQAPGDVGYEAPAVIPELDLQGGTVFKVGEDEYQSMAEAQEALAPEPEQQVDEDQVALERGEE